jgi:hypothetical protein
MEKAKPTGLSVVNSHPVHPWRTLPINSDCETIDLLNVVIRLGVRFQRDTEA